MADVIVVLPADGSDAPTLFVNYKTGVSTFTFSADTSTGSNRLTNTSIPLGDKIVAGAKISGAGIASNSYVVSVDSNGDVLLSKNCTSNVDNSTITMATATIFSNNETIVVLNDTYDSNGLIVETFKAQTVTAATL